MEHYELKILNQEKKISDYLLENEILFIKHSSFFEVKDLENQELLYILKHFDASLVEGSILINNEEVNEK